MINDSIKDNIKEVYDKINAECERNTRPFESVKLIAVSKTKPVSLLQEAYDAGMRDFGENKVQEILEKYDKLPSDIRWHMIGHLQTNKVKYIIDKVCLIHSVDSVKLATEINKQAEKNNLVMDILIEINIGNEESKFGVSIKEAPEVVAQISKLSNVRIKGLMTVAPFTENPEENRKYFKQMKQLVVDIISYLSDNSINDVSLDELSMGMTGDYVVAVSEGATYVRVGTGIFGARNYNI